MAQNLYHEYTASGDVTRPEVREALDGLTDDDISDSSPITEGAEEAAVAVQHTSEGSAVVVTVEGHDGEWTYTSENAVKSAVRSVEGVGDLVDSEGGYEPES